jgi:aminoglycoside phosphotransferase (APT) family kinase protein
MQPPPQAHGSILDAAEEVLLRARPPASALAWAAAAVGPGAVVRSVRPLLGGTSSAVHEVLVSDQRDRIRPLVLRRYVRRDWLEEQPDLAEREAEVLELLESTALPVPRLVAVDPDGGTAGAPALLMSALRGRVNWSDAHEERRLEKLTGLLRSIHATPLAAHHYVRAYAPAYRIAQLAPPTGTSRPELWEQAFTLYAQPPSPSRSVLIHRDFHPGNILWSGAQVVGVVDWATSSRGDPAADVGHCRANLTEFGIATADRFLKCCEDAGVCDDYNPYWDLAAAVDLGHSADEPDLLLESWLAAAVAALR